MTELCSRIQYPWWAAQAMVKHTSTTGKLYDRGYRFADNLIMRDRWAYKVTGDFHPNGGVFAEPDWGISRSQPSRYGLAKVRHYRWPDGSRVRERHPVSPIPIYGRFAEVVPLESIDRVIHPEEVAAALANSPRTPEEHAFARLYRLLQPTAVKADGCIGLNGSYAKGLAIRESDFDIDVYGSAAAEAVGGHLQRLMYESASGLQSRWPLDPQTNLYYLQKIAYRDIDPRTLWHRVEDLRRNWFNFTFEGVKVSIQYHSSTRLNSVGSVDPQLLGLSEPSEYSGTFVCGPSASHLDLPARVHLEDVYDSDTAIGRVVIWCCSKGFYYCRAGDRVVFRAMLAHTGEESESDARIMVIPDFVDWPIRVLLLSGQ